MIMIIKLLSYNDDDDDEMMTGNLKGLSETFKAHFPGKTTKMAHFDPNLNFSFFGTGILRIRAASTCGVLH